MNGIGNYSVTIILTNIAVVFGFIDSSKAIPMGGWSIGNEIVFYLFTPVILYLYDKKKLFGNIVLVASVLIGLYYAFGGLSKDVSLATQWSVYVNPLNNIFLFIIGIGIYYNLATVSVKPIVNYGLLSISILIYAFYPYKDQIGIVTGIDRIVYVFIVSIWVFCFFKIRVSKLTVMGKLFKQFGIATYGVYLLHPIILSLINTFFDSMLHVKVDSFLLSCFAVIMTIFIALMSYYLFEIKISMWGKKMLKKYI